MTKLINRQIADRWEDGLLIGNGGLGLVLYGAPDATYLDFSKQDLFLKCNNMEDIPNLAPHLKELRKIIETEGYKNGINFFYEKAIELGYKGLTMSDPFIPAARFLLTVENSESFDDYQRITDFTRGTIHVDFTSPTGGKVKQELFASKKYDCIYGKIISDYPISGDISIIKWEETNLLQSVIASSEGQMKLVNRYQDQSGYDIVFSIVTKDGNVIMENEKLVFQEVTNCYFTIQYVEKDEENSQVTPYEKALQEHIDEFSKTFHSVQLLLTDEKKAVDLEVVLNEMRTLNKVTPEFMQIFYEGSRYVIQSMAKGIPTLQGIWSGTLHPAWSGDYTFDTNVQLAISSLASSGYIQEYRSFFTRLKEYFPDFRENAKSYYGCNGFLVPGHASTTAKHVHWNKEWPLIFWISGAGWLAHFYHEYWDYTRDETFLRIECIPFYEEVLAFYMDFSQRKDGQVLLSPSYSAENGMGDNTTMDIAIMKSVLKHYFDAKNHLNEEIETKYKQFYKEIPSYRLLEDGGIAEWLDERSEENDNHRHFSNLYPLFQTKEINKDTPELWNAAKIAFEKRMVSWLNNSEGDTTSSHGRMHASMCALSLEDEERVAQSLEALILEHAFMDSLATAHYSEKEVFNMDANGSIPKVIHDCLLYAEHNHSLTVLKAVPYFLKKGRLKGIYLPNRVHLKLLEWDIDKGIANVLLEQDDDNFPKLNLGSHYIETEGTTKSKNQLENGKWQYHQSFNFLKRV